jgi:integrase
VPKPRAAKLETPTARRKLPIRRKPFFVTVSPNVRLAYRRNLGPGTWSVRVTGPGIDWLKRIALADDLEPADGKAVLTYWQAIDAARALARREPGDIPADDDRTVTVAEALDAYERNLMANGGDPYNARRARFHISAALLSKPVALLTIGDMVRWRDGLIAKALAPASINRTRNCLRAALSLAAQRDRRIQNRHVWEEGLEPLADATLARNTVLPDADTVGRFVATAYVQDHDLGLLVETMAETAARPSQLVRITVGDLDLTNPGAPKLRVPRSAKGNPRTRARKMSERVPVPISPALAARLREAAGKRADDAPLLTRANGEPWGYRRNDRYRDGIAAIVAALGLDAGTTLYCLRHTAITRQLLLNTPIRVVAACADTSVREIERHYARYITAHADTDALMRRALLDIASPADNLVASGRRV